MGEQWKPAQPAGFFIERKVPVALVFAFAGQLLFAVWQAAQLHSLVQQHDRRIMALEVADAERARQHTETRALLAEIRATLAATQDAVRRLERAAERLGAAP